MKKIAIALIILGLGLTIFTAITFYSKEKVVEIGNVEITKDKSHHLNWSPIIGIGVMGVGVFVYWLSYKKL